MFGEGHRIIEVAQTQCVSRSDLIHWLTKTEAPFASARGLIKKQGPTKTLIT